MSTMHSALYNLQPCDTERPYIFISYSSHDSDLVWQDALEFQKRGYNIWLDEKDLDKTKPSWREDAIAAIEDMECELVVFYVSSNSLRSSACFQELSKTVEERTCAMHFGPVKFIAVDAEPVGDITAFSQKVFGEIRGSSLSKEERNRQALALDGFMRDFFNSNNEKVRIHPKNDTNRKIDYYNDIIAAFPDSARIYDPKAKEFSGANRGSFTNAAANASGAATAGSSAYAGSVQGAQNTSSSFAYGNSNSEKEMSSTVSGTYVAAPAAGQKSMIVAFFLGIFLGIFGAHNFYLKYTPKAILQLVLTILGCSFLYFIVFAVEIWAIVESVMILCGRINVDGNGVPLKR